MHSPGAKHWQVVKCIFHYLSGIRHLGLLLAACRNGSHSIAFKYQHNVSVPGSDSAREPRLCNTCHTLLNHHQIERCGYTHECTQTLRMNMETSLSCPICTICLNQC